MEVIDGLEKYKKVRVKAYLFNGKNILLIYADSNISAHSNAVDAGESFTYYLRNIRKEANKEKSNVR